MKTRNQNIMKYNTPKSANAEGGKKAQAKLYKCPICDTMGHGSRFINQHLATGCKGPGYKTLKQQHKFKGREAEAMLNTAVYNAQKMINDERAMFNEMRDRIRKDIETMREMGQINASNIF